MVQWLRALAILAEKNRLNPSVNPSAGRLNPSVHMIAYNHLQLWFQEIQCPLLASMDTRHVHVMCTHADETLIHIK